MTNEMLNSMATALEAYIKDTEISQNEAAKKIGINPSYITHALKRNWNGVPTGGGRKTRFNAATARRIMIFLGIDTVVWETSNFKDATGVLAEAKEFHEHRIISGSKGTGKTFTAKHFRKMNPHETFLITCSEDMNPKSFMVELARSVSSDMTGDRRKIRIALSEKLKRMTYPIIIVDEAENLKPSTYGSIKALYDSVEDYCSIILIGANNYFDMLDKKAKAGKGCFPQIFSRFSAEPVFLSEMFKDDVKMVAQLNGITDKDEVSKLFTKCADFRELDRSIKRILRDKNL